MFHELFESTRAPSPWDKFSVSPSPKSKGLAEIEMRRVDGVPKLTPEIEQGNVEYKLKLLNPSPDRFNRLVTQLNWRLMEGNGQAYYQLGVADSGQLVGLTKSEMEATLETLEAMAGEIGASVVVNREIEVSPSVLEMNDTSNGGTAWWKSRRVINGALREARSRGVYPEMLQTGSDLVVGTGTESSETEVTETDEDDSSQNEHDPNEILVRSAPKPTAHGFLRHKSSHKSCQPPPPTALDDETDDFGVFGFEDLQMAMSLIKESPSTTESEAETDKMRKAKTYRHTPKQKDQVKNHKKGTAKKSARGEPRATLKPDSTITPESIVQSKTQDNEATIKSVTSEPRMIVEALVVRKAGFGKAYMDLSQFDEELRQLPSFSLN